MIIRLLFIFTALLFGFQSFAQKKALQTSDFASWKRIENRQISNNGQYVAYELNEQKGNGVLIVHDTKTSHNDSIPFAYKAKLSPNSDFIVFKYKPAADSIRAAKKAELKKDDMPKDSVGILNLVSRQTTNYTNIKSFAVPIEDASWVAVLIDHIEAKIEEDTTLLNDTLSVSNDSTTIDSVPKAKKSKEKDLKDLIVQNPISNSKYEFNHVESYAFAKQGGILGIVCKENDSLDVSTVIAFNTILERIDTVFRDTGLVKQLAVNQLGTQIAFLYSRDTVVEKVFALYLTEIASKKSQLIVDTLSTGMPSNYSPSENGKVFFSDDATKLYFGTAIKPMVQPEDSLLAEEKPKVDVWSWTDIDLQPAQLLNLEKEKKRTYQAVYRIKDKKTIQIGDTIITHTKLRNKNNGEIALGWTNKPYKRATSWNGKWINDYYLIDLKSGQKEKILSGQEDVFLSPNGQFTVWYKQEDSSYNVRNNTNGKSASLSGELDIPFYNELNDIPNNPSIYGLMGWTENNEVVIYDRYDIWKFDLTGKSKPINLTNNVGREQNIKFRYEKLDKKLVYLPENGEIFLSGFNESNCEDGIYKTNYKQAQSPQQLIKGDYRISHILKAKNADQVIWSTQTVKDYPEIKLSQLDFSNPKVLSISNPQQDNFNWATAELVYWTSFSGEELRGILYKPENFDASKKYPMMVYFYERSSNNIHRHFTPYPSQSIINKTFYASNGYLVFVPDITYNIGYPGQSAYNAIVSGTQYLTSNYDFVDTKHIGLQGQSWGGYQIAYLITQTDMFKAAMAGAPVSNMTSAYGGIRWGSGMSRMFQYEHTQSRIGGTLWDKPMQYIENSPVFYAPKVNTPLLIMHNDKDGAVPWYQGIEYFVALRRLNKPAWLLNYNGMKHNIEAKYWANRMDLSNRMLQYFNHYLKNETAPEWMIKGVPAIEKGNNLGY